MTTRREAQDASEQLVDKLFKQFAPAPESPNWKLSEAEQQRRIAAPILARAAMVAAFMDYAERLDLIPPPPSPEV
jgi:hypothetical protein